MLRKRSSAFEMLFSGNLFQGGSTFRCQNTKSAFILDEGYIKYQANWERTTPYSGQLVSQLIRWRQACYQKGWIGSYENGIGFGNISLRIPPSNQFFITGSATGGMAKINEQHITRVEKVAAQQNELWCTGPIVASSESMSHAAIYLQLPWVQGVIHIHHLELWRAALHSAPTTAATAAYGTPEMVDSIVELITTSDLPQQKFFVLEGHEEGAFAFGASLAEAFSVLEAGFEHYGLHSAS